MSEKATEDASAGEASDDDRTGRPATEDAGPTCPDQSRLSRLLLSIFLLVSLVATFSSVMPNSLIKDGLLTVTRPYLFATGLDQHWGLFAPNPRLDTSYVFARVDHTDGTVGIQGIPTGAGPSEYWNYRWRNYGEQLWTAADADPERRAFAPWVVDRDRAAGRQPVRVTLLRRTASNLPPGPGPDEGPWQDVPFFSSMVRTR